MAILSGTLIAEKFEVLEQLGEGGMGEVFRARQSSMHREVALKLLKEMGAMDDGAFKRFQREAKILGTLHHPNLVKCYEFGRWNGMAYIAMEMVHGKSLQDELLANSGIEPTRLIRIAAQIARALEYAHANGVFHRDLKPQNIMLCAPASGEDEELVKLIDFGLAKLLPIEGAAATKLTGTGMAVGSVVYMPPEQCLGQHADARSDLYSTGAVLYHALSGRPPFEADNPVAMMYMHLQDAPPNIGLKDLPAGLENLIRTCLAKDPANRFQSASELLEALHMVADGHGGVIQPPEFSTERLAQIPFTDVIGSNKESKKAVRSKKLIMLSLATVLVLCFAVAMTWYFHAAAPVPPTPPTSVISSTKELPTTADIEKQCVDSARAIGNYRAGRIGRSSLETRVAAIANDIDLLTERNWWGYSKLTRAKLYAVECNLYRELDNEGQAVESEQQAKRDFRFMSVPEREAVRRFLERSETATSERIIGLTSTADSKYHIPHFKDFPNAEVVPSLLDRAQAAMNLFNYRHEKSTDLLYLRNDLAEFIASMHRKRYGVSPFAATKLYAATAAINQILGESKLAQGYAVEARLIKQRLKPAEQAEVEKMLIGVH